MVWQNRVQHLNAAGRKPTANLTVYLQSISRPTRHFISIPAHSLSMTGTQPFPENFLVVSSEAPSLSPASTPAIILAVALSLVRPKGCCGYGYCGLNKCGESSDPPPPPLTYTSLSKSSYRQLYLYCFFLSCGRANLPSDNAL